MIKIYRTQPYLETGNQLIKLTPTEHRLVIALGMLDNKMVPRELLLEVLCEERVQIPADQSLLSLHLCRLKKKLGSQMLRSKRQIGYQLIGPVEFIG